MNISAVLIVKNEEKILSYCLNSLIKFPEIIIVDTGSEDGTIDLIKRKQKFNPNIKLFSFPWCDDFSKARNYALQFATGDWVLSIDADEVLKTDYNILKGLTASHQMYGCDAINIKLFSKNCTHFTPRLFKNNKLIKWQGACHEFIINSKNQRTEQKIVIEYGYSDSHKIDPNRNLRILQNSFEKTGSLRDLFYLGREYFYNKSYNMAISLLKEYCVRSKFNAEKAEAFYIIAQCYNFLNDKYNSYKACFDCLFINPQFKAPYTLIAKLFSNPDDSKLFIQFSKLALNINTLFKYE